MRIESTPPAPLRSGAYGAGIPGRPRCSRAQPQEHLRHHPPRPADGDHRAVGIGQVVARLRHDLRRGPAPVRRVAVGLCASVPGPHGEARCRRDRGALAGDRHRAEDRRPQSPLHRRHRHRDLRLPAAALGPGRGAALSQRRQPRRALQRYPDHRDHPHLARGHPHRGARAAGARPQGRVPRAVRRHPPAGFRPGAGGR